MIDDSDADADIELRFGESLNATLFYERNAGRFVFSKSLLIRGNLTVTGSLTITSVTSSGGVAYASGSRILVTPKGLSGQILQSGGTAAPLWRTPTGGMVWYLDGVQAVGAGQGAEVTMPFGLTLTSVTMNAKGAPTGAALVADIKKDGTTVFATKPQVNANAVTGGTGAVFSSTDLPVDAVVTLDITQVGSTYAGSGLTVILRGVRKY